MGNAVANAASNEEDEDPLDVIFASRGSVNLSEVPNFNSTDLTAAAAAIMASSESDDVGMLSTSSSSSSDEEELGDFLWAGFDPNVQDLTDLCTPY